MSISGIAVGAGELQEETVKELNETRVRLQDAMAELEVARKENEELRTRLSTLN